MVKMWSLSDYKLTQTEASGKPYLSARVQREYDCQGEQVRTLHGSFHSGQMGGGAVVFSDSGAGKWIPIPPGTTGAFLWKIACGQK